MKLHKRRKKVVVCGTTFGQFYCEALSRLNEIFEFAGILANGSERSKKCAEKYGVKLYQRIEDLADDIDIACVVVRSSIMGGNGSDLALHLLNKGIHVIQEQPIHYKEIETCIKAAKKNNVIYQVGSLYRHLPSVKNFTKLAKKIVEITKPIYMDIGLAAQVSYPLFDILSGILPTMRPFIIKRVDRESGPFHIITAEIWKVSAIFQIHNEVNPAEPDNYMHYLHRITIGTNCGRLCLEDTQGPVRWHNKMHVPLNAQLDGVFNEKWPEDLKRTTSAEIGIYEEKPYGVVFQSEWVEAVAYDMKSMEEKIKENQNLNLYYTRIVTVSRLWHDFTNQLGFAELIEPSPNFWIDIKEIKRELQI